MAPDLTLLKIILLPFTGMIRQNQSDCAAFPVCQEQKSTLGWCEQKRLFNSLKHWEVQEWYWIWRLYQMPLLDKFNRYTTTVPLYRALKKMLLLTQSANLDPNHCHSCLLCTYLSLSYQTGFHVESLFSFHFLPSSSGEYFCLIGMVDIYTNHIIIYNYHRFEENLQKWTSIQLPSCVCVYAWKR